MRRPNLLDIDNGQRDFCFFGKVLQRCMCHAFQRIRDTLRCLLVEFDILSMSSHMRSSSVHSWVRVSVSHAANDPLNPFFASLVHFFGGVSSVQELLRIATNCVQHSPRSVLKMNMSNTICTGCTSCHWLLSVARGTVLWRPSDSHTRSGFLVPFANPSRDMQNDQTQRMHAGERGGEGVRLNVDDITGQNNRTCGSETAFHVLAVLEHDQWWRCVLGRGRDVLVPFSNPSRDIKTTRRRGSGRARWRGSAIERGRRRHVWLATWRDLTCAAL